MTTTTTRTVATPLPSHAHAACHLSDDAAATTAPGHCVVLSIGDSLGQGLGWALAREFAPSSGFTLVQAAKASTGLANHSYYNWPQHFAQLEAWYRPDLAVIMLGGNDEQGTYTAQGVGASFGTPLWVTTYSSAIKAITATAASYDTRIVWLGMPVCQPYWYNYKLKLLNQLYQHVGGASPGVTYLPTAALLANGEGAFRMTAYVNGMAVDIRDMDGIHMSSYGYDVIATYVVREIASLYHVAVAPASPAVITR